MHKTKIGRLLIVEGDVNKQVLQTYITGAHNMLTDNLPLIQILLQKLITGSLAYKQQWLESMAADQKRFEKRTSRRPV